MNAANCARPNCINKTDNCQNVNRHVWRMSKYVLDLDDPGVDEDSAFTLLLIILMFSCRDGRIERFP